MPKNNLSSQTNFPPGVANGNTFTFVGTSSPVKDYFPVDALNDILGAVRIRLVPGTWFIFKTVEDAKKFRDTLISVSVGWRTMDCLRLHRNDFSLTCFSRGCMLTYKP